MSFNFLSTPEVRMYGLVSIDLLVVDIICCSYCSLSAQRSVFNKSLLEKSLFCCKLTELQSQCPDPAAPQSQEGEGSLGTAQGWTGEESWRVQLVAGPSENQLECVVSWRKRESFPLTPSCVPEETEYTFRKAKLKRPQKGSEEEVSRQSEITSSWKLFPSK